MKWASLKDGVFSSALKDVPDIPEDMDLPEFMFNFRPAFRSDPSKAVWYIDPTTGKETTYADCLKRTNLLSKALHNEYGVGKNDVVLIFSPNSQEYATCCWATMQLGGIISAANPSYTPGELAYQISTVAKMYNIKAMITHPASLSTAQEAAKQAGLDSGLISLMEDPPQAASVTTINKLIKKHESGKDFTRYKFSSGEAKTKIAFLSFSSGTTGLPKAVMISHYNVMANVLQYNSFRQGRYTPGKSRCLAVLPFYHIYGLVVVLHSQLFANVTLIVLPKFEFSLFLSLIPKYKVDLFYIVPPMAVMLVKSPEAQKADLTSMRDIMIGAAPLSGEVLNAMKKRLPKAAIGQGYGMTETSTVVTSAPNSLENPNFPAGSIGVLLANCQMRIIDPEGKAQGVGKVGELLIKSPSVTLGYLNNKKATDDTFRDGWVHTGDEAYVDETQVAPAELEGELLSHQIFKMRASSE